MAPSGKPNSCCHATSSQCLGIGGPAGECLVLEPSDYLSVESMPRRVLAVLRAKGGATYY